MSIVLSVVFYGIMFSLDPTLLSLIHLFCVLCHCFKPCHLSSFTLLGPHSDTNNNITPCFATKLKVCYLLQMLFFITFDYSMLDKNSFVTLINCYFIVHVFDIFSLRVENFYNQTGKTMNTRNISGIILCCKIKASWA